MKIMAVDNNPAALAVLVDCLHEVYPESEVVEFFDPLLAAKCLFQSQVDMVYTETAMKSFDGLLLLDWAKDKPEGVCVVFVTGITEHKEWALTNGAAGYIFKPVTAAAIRKVNEFREVMA